MSDMIEKVARAISGDHETSWARRPNDKVEYRSLVRSGIISPSTATRDDYRDDAKAVLTALLEPSDAMAAAGADNLFGSSSDDWSDDARAVWSAMVQAALEEKEG
jgi:hypothetical protein